MTLVESMATRNPCYKSGKTIKTEGIMIEGVGCPQPSAKVFAHNRNRENCEGKCTHAFVDANDGNVIQILPWDRRGWHCGKHPRTKKNANDTHIGIQLCEPSQIRYKKKNVIELVGDKEKALAAVSRTYKSAVEICAKLCSEFGFDPTIAIISRKEGYEAGLCSMQASPEFVWDAVGATYEMDTFRADVQMAMTGERIEEVPDYIKEDLEIGEKIQEGLTEGLAQGLSDPIEDPTEETLSAIAEGFARASLGGNVPTVNPVLVEEKVIEDKDDSRKVRMVRINVENLRIRKTPEMGNNTTGKFTGKGTFAITEIQNGNGSKKGWGKLQNGAGWICLDFVEML